MTVGGFWGEAGGGVGLDFGEHFGVVLEVLTEIEDVFALLLG
jgi:hypothetical protein